MPGLHRRGWLSLLGLSLAVIFSHPASLFSQQKSVVSYSTEEIKQQEILKDLRGSIWNDTDLTAGGPGFLWMLGQPVREGDKIVQPWYMSSRTGLPQVGYWELEGTTVTLKARNGVVLGTAEYSLEDHLLQGHYLKPKSKTPYGRIELHREFQRPYRLILSNPAGK